MRKYYILLFCAWICTMCVNLTSQAETIYNDSTLQNLHYGESGHGDTPSISEWISILTLTVNDINNLITAENNLIAAESNRLNLFTIIISIVALMVTIGVWFWYKKTIKLRNDIKSTKNDLEKTIEKIQQDIVKQREEISNQHTCTLKTTEKINGYLFKITNTVVDTYDNSTSPDGMPPDPESIRESLYHDYYMVALFLPYSEKETEAAFDYIGEQGFRGDIGDLEEIANTDPDERKRNRAREVIGYIRGRLDQEAKPDDTMVNADR